MTDPVAAKGEMPATEPIAKWCCEGNGKDQHADECRYSDKNFAPKAATPSPPAPSSPTESKMKTIDQVYYCQLCENDFPPFAETSEHEIFIRKYVGQHGHLISMAFHRECLMQDLKMDLILSGSSSKNAAKTATVSAPSSLERDWRKISEELLVANKRVQDLTTELAAEVLKNVS